MAKVKIKASIKLEKINAIIMQIIIIIQYNFEGSTSMNRTDEVKIILPIEYPIIIERIVDSTETKEAEIRPTEIPNKM